MLNKARIVPESKYRSEKLEALVAEWQKILRLQDWNVGVYEVPHCELNETEMACCYTHIPSRAAIIFILREEERKDREDMRDGIGMFPHDTTEALVVHELLHLYTQQMGVTKENFKSESMEYTSMEQAVAAISHALVNLRVSVKDLTDQLLDKGVQQTATVGPRELFIEPELVKIANKVLAKDGKALDI